MPSYLDLNEYSIPPRIGGHHALVLVEQLVLAAPADLHPYAERAKAKMLAKASRVFDVHNTRATPTIGLRAAYAPLDAAWGALAGRLSAATKLPTPEASDRAKRIVERLFPDGLAFLLRDASTKYGETSRKLDIIEEDGLAPEIERIAGVGFLDAVKTAQVAFGEVLGVGSTPIVFERGALRAAVNDLALAIADYARTIAAMVDRDDAASIRTYQLAMMPFDRFRERRARRRRAPELSSPPT